MHIHDNQKSKLTENSVLILIVLAQFLCTSIWFAINAVMDGLLGNYDLPDNSMEGLTVAVQAGFIGGTLFYALFNISDRFSPSKVFFLSAVLGATFNLGIVYVKPTLFTFISMRFFVGFFLAGIYPVGMKIASDYFKNGLGRSMGLLVGALVLGTALPHVVSSFLAGLSWELVFVFTSCLCLAGGILILVFVPDGPFRKPAQHVLFKRTIEIFRDRKFRLFAFGYFGHMWELYTFWAFVPVIVNTYVLKNAEFSFSSSALSFMIIGAGTISCIIAGQVSNSLPTKIVAFSSLSGSLICCLIAPWVLNIDSAYLVYIFLLLWGMLVIADSPMFSALVAEAAPVDLRGSALTIVTCIGFGLTVVSIQIVSWMVHIFQLENVLMMLALGPFLAIIHFILGSNHE